MVSVHTWLPNGHWVHLYGLGMERVRGDDRDGIYRTDVLRPDHYGGTWSLEFTVVDRAHVDTAMETRYAGPTSRRRLGGLPIPDERGDFTFVGEQISETAKPEIVAASLTPTEVHTLEGPAQVSFTVNARDVGAGVSSVSARLRSLEATSVTFYNHLELIAGNRHDGTWTGQVTLPQGTAPGDFTATLTVTDLDHNHAFYYGEQLALPTVTVMNDSSP